ncbi:alpha/beta hydrolase fold domain-containing protein [Saccharopolyspora sp. NPDC000995]
MQEKINLIVVRRGPPQFLAPATGRGRPRGLVGPAGVGRGVGVPGLRQPPAAHRALVGRPDRGELRRDLGGLPPAPPAHRFLAALDHAYALPAWRGEHAAELGVDPGRIAVGGHSAGGRLAAGGGLAAGGEVAGMRPAGAADPLPAAQPARTRTADRRHGRRGTPPTGHG